MAIGNRENPGGGNQRLTEKLANGAETGPRLRTHPEEESRHSVPIATRAAFTAGNRTSVERSQINLKSARPPTEEGDPSNREFDNHSSKHSHSDLALNRLSH
ncbi:multidrug resistance-associated protein 4 [Striga asiatica]|uniref:Multidrug resistance-associated protein 4 n=1 Tax=Striga asiatica TaxID=4170 RepID=A0A5A7PDJ9_STRAF|nr:multidrug resistance-associated protein 4 [Striga asiatica]